MRINNFKLKIFLGISIGVFILFGSVKLYPLYAYVSYPIPELGYCSSERECQFYCEIPKNTPACWSYGKYVMNASEDVLGEETGPELTFPISELGNCASANECFIYCSKPQNQKACYNFAKTKGLVKEIETDPTLQKAVEAAKTELGCESKEVCRSLCNQPENFDKCRTFAQKYSLLKSQSQNREPLSEEILTAAQTELGCNSRETCADVCHQKENRKKCKEFAEKYGLGPPPKVKMSQPTDATAAGIKVTPSKSPGGCTSEIECRQYCEKHPSECPGFTQKPSLATQSGQFLGPGGCKTEAECKAYCTKHPKECPGFPKVLPKLMPVGTSNTPATSAAATTTATPNQVTP